MKLPKRYQDSFGSILMYARLLIIGVIMLGLIAGTYVALVAFAR